MDEGAASLDLRRPVGSEEAPESGRAAAADVTDEAYLRRIVADAASIAERLNGGFEPIESDASATLGRQRLGRWRDKLTGSGPSAFERRLQWLGTSAEQAVPRLGEVRFTGPLPGWAEWLARTLDAMPGAPRGSDRSSPFSRLIAPFVDRAREAIASAFTPLFTATALDALLASLAVELGHIAAPIFYVDFCAARDGAATSPASTALHDAFVDRMLRGGMRELFRKFPVAARLLATTLGDFVDNSLALAVALTDDAAAIARCFSGGRPVGKVVALRTSLSDRHNRGRTVSLLTFENGLQLVHKPRDIAIERAWFELLAELNSEGAEFGLLQVLTRKERGWVEFARPQPCAEAADFERYYRRAGMLLGMLYALEASDCFFENIVARGAWPLLIDMETLMHPVVRALPDLSPADTIADDILFNSVFRAGFLPAWETGPAGDSVDISGLGAEPGQVTSYVQRVWRDVGTDAMALGQQPISVDARDHLPTLNGVPGRAADHVDAVIDGFTRIYRAIMARAPEWLGSDGFGRRFAGTEIRFMIHATRLYGLVLKRLGAPRHMRSGVERSIEMDVISRFYLESHKQDRFYPLLAAEIAALDRLDIPKFTVRADARSLRLPTGAVLDDIFGETAIERVERRIRSFSDADLRLQVQFIRASLGLASLIVRGEPEAVPDGDDEETAVAITPDEMIDEARAIGDELSARAILSADGSATWISAQLLPGANRHELRPLRLDLYSGLAGVAVFLAALFRVTGSDRDLALATLAPLRRYLSTADAAQMTHEGYTLGAATGAGSFVAALAWCAEWLDEPLLYDDAIGFCRKITPAWIRADTDHDVMAGSAGAILGLLCLYRRRPDPAVLAKAVACGDHLLARAEHARVGVTWRAPAGGHSLTGFSHGAAGIAAALDRLHAVTGAPRFGRLADQAIAWEDSLFDAREENWPDLRHGGADAPGGTSFMSTWCHGAPGIGLGRAIGLRTSADAGRRADFDMALRTTERHGIGDRDGLCCGVLGRAELLMVTAADVHDRQARARRWATQVLRRKRRTGAYRLTDKSGQAFFDPSFFQGLSGIGYQLLRIATPGRLPSVLGWE